MNRVDDIIVFNKLNEEQIGQIARHMLKELEARLAEMQISITFTDEAIKAIANEGYDPVYGARPLRRAICAQIEDPISEKILDGTVKAEDQVVCSYKDGAFTFEKQ